MIIGGLLKNSLIDYPGKLSCGIFLSGCNFDCPYCHNPDLAKGCSLTTAESDLQNVYRFIENRKGFLDGVVISGGEPTLQKDLFDLCENIKQMGYPVKLDTNGSRPEVLKPLIQERLLDYVAMDVKCDPLKYSPFITGDSVTDRIFSSIRIIMESNIDYEFRTTCVKPIVDENMIEAIAKTVKGARLLALQHFNDGKVLDPQFFQKDTGRNELPDLDYLRSIAEPWVERCIVR